MERIDDDHLFALVSSRKRIRAEDNKFIGAYSTRANAEVAIDQLKDQPGFRDDPRKFGIYECTLDRTSWREGFITIAEAMHPRD